MGYSLPTWHNGIKYRSRTEARWAVFFEHLDIKFAYEAQGFVSGGTAYLPDFMTFPALGTLWAEIKPSYDNDPDGVERWRKFAAERPQPSRTVLLIGAPSHAMEAVVIGGDENAKDPVRGPWEADDFAWRPCPAGIHFDLAYPGKFRSKFAEDGCEPDAGGQGEERIAAAISAAMSARFSNPRGKGTAA